MPLAQKFITERKYPSHTRVERVVADGEPAAFREYFTSWTDNNFEAIRRAFHCKLVTGGRLIANFIHDCEQNVSTFATLSFCFIQTQQQSLPFIDVYAKTSLYTASLIALC